MRVLIIGKHSYIGNKAKQLLERCGHFVKELDAITDGWCQEDYTGYDAILHVAAIVHENAKTSSEDTFEKVNVELPLAVADKAKRAGVKQFVFLSTMAVYGVDKALSDENCCISEDTPCNPVSLYGKSKWKAEQRLTPLQDEYFTVAVVRPPNVYGPACRGNYMRMFQKLAKLMVVCPKAFTDIRQSMLYVDNLAELIRLIIEQRAGGVFLPQDDIAPNTVELIEQIRRVLGKKTVKSSVLGAMVTWFKRLSPIKKIYGGVYYDESLSTCFDNSYRIVTFEEGISNTYKIDH